ncbi:MAG: hypothetical protein ACLTYN_08325 [Dysosmobacter welbionis]
MAVPGDSWLPAVETVPAGKEFDYVLATAGAAVETCPADVPPAVMQAAVSHLADPPGVGIGGLLLHGHDLDKDGNLWVLEANSCRA